MSAGATPPAANVVELENVRFAFPRGEFALHVPWLALACGERLALVGPSGSGKTTLLDLVAGIAMAQAGRVSTAGFEWASHAARARRAHRRRRIGIVFQEFELLPYLSALENVLVAAHLDRELGRAGAHAERARELLARAGIGHLASRKPARLSHGERQRVAICRALVTRPALVLADEPTGSLDPHSARTVRDLLVAEAAASGAALIVATHDAALFASFERSLAMDTITAGAAGAAAR